MKNFIQKIMDKQGITTEELNCIQRAMLLLDMNTSQLSKLTGLSYTTAQNIATGKTDVAKMHVERFLKIAHGLGMTAEELYYGEERPIAYADEREADIHRIWGELDEERRGRLHNTAQDMEIAKSNEGSAVLAQEVAE